MTVAGLPPHILAAMAGGIIGSLWVFDSGRSGVRRALIETAISAVAAAAAAEYRLPPDKVWLCCAAGIGAGLAVGHALDAFKSVAPAALRAFLQKWTDKWTK